MNCRPVWLQLSNACMNISSTSTNKSVKLTKNWRVNSLTTMSDSVSSIPGVGPITASALAAEMGDGKQYGCSRDFAASVGLVPRQYSTGGKSNLLGISRRGDKNVRRCWSCAHELTCGASINEPAVWQSGFARC